MDLTTWTAIAAVFAGLTTVLVGVGGYLAYRELGHTRARRDLEATHALLASTDSGTWRPLRRLLYQPGFGRRLADTLRSAGEGKDASAALDELLSTASPDETATHDTLHAYVSSLEIVAMLVLYDMAPDDVVTAYFGRIVVHHWPLLEPYVAYVRKYYGYREFLQHLECWHAILVDPDLGRVGDDGRAAMWTDRRALRHAKRNVITKLQARFPGPLPSM